MRLRTGDGPGNRGNKFRLVVVIHFNRGYEAERHPLPAVSGADMLRHLIEARAITQLELAADTGIAESTISNILAGKRRMSGGQIKALAGYFKVSPAVFLS